MLDTFEFEKKYRTDEVEKVPCRLVSGGIEETVELNRRVMQISLGELVKEYHTLLNNKPKRFVLGIIPNQFYKCDMVGWSHLENLMRSLLNDIGSIRWHD